MIERVHATAQCAGVSPNIPVRDVEVSLRFYRDVLGFQPEVGNADYGYVLMRRGPLLIALGQTDDADALAATANNIQAQIWVEDLEGYWAEIKPRLHDLPEGRSRAPFDQPYGTREFHIKDPDGFLMLFTQIDRSE